MLKSPFLVPDYYVMSGGPHLELFGFPIYFRASLAIATVLAVIILREVGLIIAITLAVSILVHELGHSFAFRRYGTESHIVVHLFGGHSAPDQPHKLSHKEWVSTSLAGPLTAFFLLGAPAFIARELWSPYGHWWVVLTVLIYFNIFWGAVNLLPIWPLDGGRVLYHSTEGDWALTQKVTLALSVVALIVAVSIGYVFAAMFIGFNAMRVFKSAGPETNGLPQNKRFNAAIKEAKRFSATTTNIKGAAGDAALSIAYQELIRDRADRAAEPLSALAKSKKLRKPAEIAASGEPSSPTQRGSPISRRCWRRCLPTTPEPSPRLCLSLSPMRAQSR